MHNFLRNRELLSFSVASEFFPKKKKFLSKVVELDGQKFLLFGKRLYQVPFFEERKGENSPCDVVETTRG